MAMLTFADKEGKRAGLKKFQYWNVYRIDCP